MIATNRFPRPSCVFLDGDNSESLGCQLLPGEDAPERVVFSALAERKWEGLRTRIGRPHSQVVDVCSAVMNLSDHHQWVRSAADRLLLGGDTLWQAMCAEWADNCLSEVDGKAIAEVIQDTISGIESTGTHTPAVVVPPPVERATPVQTPSGAPIETLPLFELSDADAQG